MKFIRLGYIEPGTFEGMTEDEPMTICGNGHLIEPPDTALTPVLEKRKSRNRRRPL